MEQFLESGHLSDKTLMALAAAAPLAELERLEIAEHLAFCDACLLRYTSFLTEETLLTPETSCELGLWRRVRQRTLRLAASRWTTAAAALAIVFCLWGFGVFSGVVDASVRFSQDRQPALTEELQAYPGRWSDAANGFFDQLGRMLDSAFDGGRNRTPTTPSGGNHHAT